ncbi:glycosyltransferase family 4 protein [Geminicoccaceae bacterium 1502E]|nr:glycosyltransferase family 4 protein [Geminicoccaceae bacterium 1502E]
MRVAFYAPLKPPCHPSPSGDRRMARALMALLRDAGHEVRSASCLRSYDRAGDAARQERLRRLGQRMAARLLRRSWPAGPPELWFTYHLYHKAPDWLGPAVAAGLGIPYVVAEASLSARQALGPWRPGHEAAQAALARADMVLAMTARDRRGLAGTVPDERLRLFPPFLDTAPFAAAAGERAGHRARLAAQHGLDPAAPWLLTVAMMREDIKRRSYEVLADALELVRDRPWRLLVAGDGPARAVLEERFAALGAGRVHFLGAVAEEALPPLYAAADLHVWPALREAYGMALLEAQAAGLAVVAGADGGVPEVVADGRTGLLAAPGDAAGFAARLRHLLERPDERRAMGRAAARLAEERHGRTAAARRLDEALRAAVALYGRRTGAPP